MARTYPAEWPATDGLDETLPTIYMHVVGSSWPPADDDTGTPAGWCEITDWDVTAGLVAPLMPGQVNPSPSFTAASGGCKVPQPDGHHLAPWRQGEDRTPTASLVELWASHNGPTGTTAFLLGQFRLDPMKGRLSDSFLSVTYAQDTVRLRKPHDIPTRAGIFSTFSPTRLLEAAATQNGFVLDASDDFAADLTSSYFPRKTNELDAMQQIVAANLGAMFPSMDGVTLKVLDPDYLLGQGAVADTLDVSDDLDDLSWSQDPNAAADRIELTYIPPSPDDTPIGPFPYDGAPVWFAPKGASIPAGGSRTYDFDPGSAITGLSGFGSRFVYGNASKDGTGASVDLPAEVNVQSSGSWSVKITNNTGSTKYLMAPYTPPGGGAGLTDYTKGTRSFLAGEIDGATETESAVTLTWGAAPEDAVNVLTFNLGRNIQNATDAQMILDRIITRVTRPTYVLEDVQVPLDFRRELGDIYRATDTDVEFDTRLIVTGIKLTGTKDSIIQTVSLAVIPLIIRDFNEAWDAAHPGATIADFNTKWAGKTIADFNANPLGT